jgi:hypothetical protein
MAWTKFYNHVIPLGLFGRRSTGISFRKMENEEHKDFDSVAFFRAIKEKLAKAMEGMTLVQKQEFMQQVREGKVKLA